MTAAIDRSWIMHRAWQLIRQWNPRRVTAFDLSRALRFAWSDAKAKLAGLKLVDELTPAEHELASLENKRDQSRADLARMNELRATIDHEKAADDYAAKRELIASAKGRICAVTFTKKDGTQRVMRVQPAKLKFHVKGDCASEAGQKATATRAARHPNLFPVWDAEAKAPRSVNLATISRIAVDGAVHRFAN